MSKHEASKINVKDYLRNIVTVPEDSITIWGDGQSAWEYAKLVGERDAIYNKPRPAFATIADGAEDADRVDALEKQIDAIKEKLSASAITFHLRALWPEETRFIHDVVGREVSKQFKGQPTPSDQSRDILYGRLYITHALSKAVQRVVFASGEEIDGPFDTDQISDFLGTIDSDEMDRVIELQDQLTTRRVLRDARVDAGFPGGPADEAGEPTLPADGEDSAVVEQDPDGDAATA